jgi:hypothetical protein
MQQALYVENWQGGRLRDQLLPIDFLSLARHGYKLELRLLPREAQVGKSIRERDM